MWSPFVARARRSSSRMTDQMASMRLSRAPQVVATTKNGATILIDMVGGRYYGLNDTGTRIWELLLPGMTALEIVNALADECELPTDVTQQQLVDDVLALLSTLRSARLILAAESVRPGAPVVQ